MYFSNDRVGARSFFVALSLLRLAACAVAFAVVGGMVYAEDMDIRALQAKLAAQEARLNDLQAKMGSGSAETPASIISMRKNAKVTIGGSLDTRYYYQTSEIEQNVMGLAEARAYLGTAAVGATAAETTAVTNAMVTAFGNARNLGEYQTTVAALTAVGLGLTNVTDAELDLATGEDNAGTGRYGRRNRTFDGKQGRLYMDTAKLNVKVDVNEHMDAYLQIDLHDGARGSVGMAQNYWVRWKNICNTGFGVLVGRDGVKFGTGKPIGTIDAFYQDFGPHEFFGTGLDGAGTTADGEGMFGYSNMRPMHFGAGTSRTLQINPYWESQDGKFKAELALMGRIDGRGNSGNVDVGTVTHTGDADVYNRSINYGLGSASLRLTWKPTEDLTLTASAMNLRANYNNFVAYRGNDTFTPLAAGRGHRFEKNNSMFHAGFVYNPAALCKRLTLWGTFVQEFNAGWVDDMDVWSTNFGIMYAVTDKLKVFAQGDYMAADNGYGVVWAEAKGWRSYIGANYALGNGADLEFGWVHDNFDYENRAGWKHTEFKADLIYAKLGFAF